MQNAIYILDTVTDDPRFDGLRMIDETSLLGLEDIYEDFEMFETRTRDWTVPRLAPLWKPRKVKGRMHPEIDYPTASGTPAFSQRAVDTLRDLLEPNGEILPLVTPSKLGNYYAYNTTTVADVLDLKRSKITFVSDSFVALFIDHHEFIASRLKGLAIFRVPEDPCAIYVTQHFVSRVVEHNLQGFNLKKVWPVPVGTKWRIQPGVGREKKSATAKPAGPRSVGPKPGKVGKISSRPPSGPEAEALSAAIRDYEKQVGFAASSRSVREVHARIDQALVNLRASKISKEAKLDRAFWLAIAWGDATVRGLRWEWVTLHDEGGHKTIAVASPDRAYAVPVVEYIKRQATGKDAEVTSHLLYNMLAEKQMPPAKAGDLKVLG
jgi:hypothetical protein